MSVYFFPILNESVDDIVIDNRLVDADITSASGSVFGVAGDLPLFFTTDTPAFSEGYRRIVDKRGARP